MIQARALGLADRLHGLDLELRPGSLHALLGPNGAGKSSLLELLAGLLPPDRGEVRLAGRPLRDHTAEELAQRRAVVRQQAAAPTGLRAREVVALGRLPHGDEGRRPERVERSLRQTGTLELADRPMTRLSGGERQRIHLARALAQLDGVPAPVLLLDEPVSAADIGWQERTMALLRRQAREGATVLVVLHDLNLAARWADEATLLQAGRLVETGPARAVLRPARLEAVWRISFRQARLGPHAVLVPHLESR